jgi:hypothetical protein
MRITASILAGVALLLGESARCQETREDEEPRIEVAGKVMGPDGAPSCGARVSWSWNFEGGVPKSEDALVTDDQGMFRGRLTIYTDPFGLFAYSKDGLFAGFAEPAKNAARDVVIRLGPAVRVTASVTSDVEGKKPIVFASYWNTCHRSRSAHVLDLLGRKDEHSIRFARTFSKIGALEILLPAGTYDYDVYDDDFVTKTARVVLSAEKPEVTLGSIVVPPGFLAKHVGKELPEWQIAAARGTDSRKSRIADYRGKWLLVEFWGFW